MVLVAVVAVVKGVAAEDKAECRADMPQAAAVLAVVVMLVEVMEHPVHF